MFNVFSCVFCIRLTCSPFSLFHACLFSFRDPFGLYSFHAMPFILRCMAFYGRGGILTWFSAIASLSAFFAFCRFRLALPCLPCLPCLFWRIALCCFFGLSFLPCLFLFSLPNCRAASAFQECIIVLILSYNLICIQSHTRTRAYHILFRSWERLQL